MRRHRQPTRKAPRQRKLEDGTRICRNCDKPVCKGRRSYCSAECATEFEIKYFPARTRWHVNHRDHGVCAKCGWDTERVYRILKRCNREAAKWAASVIGFDYPWYEDGRRWQADHIVECVNGGWGKGLDNFRTLCTPCHKEETARLARELADKRRQQKHAPLFETRAEAKAKKMTDVMA